MKHIKPLDSLRAIAAILVIIWHWLPENHFLNTLNNGAIGVDIFFVLSGFLITGILIKNRNEAEAIANNKLVVFKNFYARRALRIFPIYYLTLLFILVAHNYLGAKFNKAEFFYGLTYTINFYLYKVQHWPDLTSHFWSLAVEEQFYLLWPFVILYINKNYLVHSIVIFILIGILGQSFNTDPEFGYGLTYTCFDAFGLGAILAWIVIFRKDLLKKVFYILGVLSAVSFSILIIEIKADIPYVPQRTLHAIIALFIIAYILLNENKERFPFSFILNNRLLLFMGKISYGIYLYHIPIIGLKFWRPFLKLRFLVPYKVYVVFIVNFCMLIFIAWLSWKIIEKPVLRLKKYFEYQDKNEMTPVKIETKEINSPAL